MGQGGVGKDIVAGAALLVVLVGGFGGWAATASIGGAVIATGRVAVESHVKKVQHREGGVVGALVVRDGERVAAGDVVVRLEDAAVRASLGVVRSEWLQLAARRARLQAERDEGTRAGAGRAARSMDEPIPVLGQTPPEPEFAQMLEAERRLLAARRLTRERQAEQLGEQSEQTGFEIGGLDAQVASKVTQLTLVAQELVGVRELFARHLVPAPRLKGLEREAARLEGERGGLVSSIARARAKIAEIRTQQLRLDAEHQEQVLQELRDGETRLGELAERELAARDQLRRAEIRAPSAGVVHELAVHTLGGVVAPGETLMLVVPEADGLVVEAQVPPASINEVSPGQAAHLRFTAFNQATTPVVQATVVHVAADASENPRTGERTFGTRLRVDRADLPAALRGKLMPGMQAEVYFETGARTALSYFVKPVIDQLQRSFRAK